MAWMSEATESLENAIGFGATDLASNRLGQLSTAQRLMFARVEAERRGYEELNHRIFVIAGPVLLLGASILTGFAVMRGVPPRAPDADKELATLVMLSVMMALGGGVALSWGKSRARNPPLRYSGRVESVEGEVWFREPEELGMGHSVPSFALEGVHFSVTSSVAAGLSHGRRYRVYYTPVTVDYGSGDTTSFMILSAEAAHGS